MSINTGNEEFRRPSLEVMMKTFLSIICIVSVSITTVRSLQCVQCFNATGISCPAPASSCPEETDSCLSVYSKVTVGGSIISYSVMRMCAIAKHCNVEESITTKDANVQIKHVCNDSSTYPNPIFQEPNKTKNGLSCPACKVINATSCKADEKVDCLGLETECISMYANITLKDGPSTTYALRGCGSEMFCKQHVGHYVFPDKTVAGGIDCKQHSKRRRRGL